MIRSLLHATLFLVLAALGMGPGAGCGSESRSGEVEVHVDTIAVDAASNSPVIILEELAGDRSLPIWIGINEARSIAAELGNEEPIRPNTHDLAKRLIDDLEGAVERVVVTELAEGIYYALILVRVHGRTIAVDARPSDAIAIGLRYQAPLFVREVLFRDSLEVEYENPGQKV